MNRFFIRDYFNIVIIIFFVLLIFWQFFLKGLLPFPGDFMLAWFEPWKTDNFKNGVITISHKPIGDDIFRQIYPFKILGMELIKKLQLPLWNPYNGAGMPLLATMHTGLLNPFNFFFLILPNYLAWVFFLLAQPIFIGIFIYLYCQKIKLSKISSLFASLAFIFSGFIIIRIIYGDYDYAILALPLLLYFIESYLQNKHSRIILFIPFTVFFLFTSVQPQIIFYILVFVLIYFIYRLIQVGFKIKNFLFVLLFFSIGLGLSAIQLIPTLELLQNASINSFSSRFIFDRFLLPIQHFITIFIPNYFGNQATYNYWGSGDYIETIAYLGIIPCLFAYIGVVTKSTKNANIINFLSATILITILLTLDWLGTRLLFSLPLPILSTSIPSRILLLTTFSICILAAYGFEKWNFELALVKSFIYKLFPFVVFIIFLLLITFTAFKIGLDCHNEFIKNCRLIALRNTLVEIGISGIGGLLFIAYLRFKQKKLCKIFPLLIILLIVSIGLYNSNKYLPFTRKEAILPTNNLILNIQKEIGYQRIFGIGSANIKTNFATYFKFYDPNYYDPLYNKRYGELVAYANTGKLMEALPRSDVEITPEIDLSSDKLFRRNRLLDILGTKYLIYKKTEFNPGKKIENVIWQDDKWIILENENALPRFYFVQNYEVIANDKKILQRIYNPSFNPALSVILEKKPAISLVKISPTNTQKINLISYDEHSLKFKINIDKPALLVLTDNYFPDWKAFIDEKETELYRANYTLRAVPVNKENSIVELRYEPLSVKIGMLISVVSLFFYLIVINKILRVN